MATCNDCIHSGVCAMRREPRCFLTYPPISENIEHECLDFHAKDRFVELPCKIGTVLFRIKQINGKPFVTNTALNKNTFWKIVIKGEFEKTVFLTREEAKQALKGRENSV